MRRLGILFVLLGVGWVGVLGADEPGEVKPPPPMKNLPWAQPFFKQPARQAQLGEPFIIGDDIARIYLDPAADAHWVTQTQPPRYTYWGPFTCAQLEELGLADHIAERTLKTIRGEVKGYHPRMRLIQLLNHPKPLAARALKLVPEIYVPPNPAVTNSASAFHQQLVDTVMKRQPAFAAMGLNAEMEAALLHLISNDPRLPDEDQFEVITGGKDLEKVPEEAWGRAINGLRAAALMPKRLAIGEPVAVPLFLHNASSEPIHLAVADRAGYDYPISTDGRVMQLHSQRVWPDFFVIPGGEHGPEFRPGSKPGVQPPAKLHKLKLMPGAVYELPTGTALEYLPPDAAEPVATDGEPKFTAKVDAPALTRLVAKPGKAKLNWRIHTTDGIEHTAVDGERHRTWPVIGGWSGVLTTAAVEVVLE